MTIYITELGSVVNQGIPLVNGMSDIAPFNKDNIIKAIRTDQDGRSTFPEFLMSIWKAGVVKYEADFLIRIVTYFGSYNEIYEEEYPEFKHQTK
jgi:uncharacterized protein YbcV (DUF1398 family)